MAKNKIGDLRNHLFEMIEKLQDPDEEANIPELIQRAETMGGLAKVIVETAKVEVQYMKVSQGGDGLPQPLQDSFLSPDTQTKSLPTS